MSCMTAAQVPYNLMPVHRVTSALDAFEKITLDEIRNSDARLLSRKEMKFLMAKDQFADLLPALAPAYRALDVNNCLMSRYETRYYDTDTFMTYLAHHNGKGNRYKLRIRHYCSSGETYLEIKEKRNTGRTVKKRLETNSWPSLSEPELASFLQEFLPGDHRAFHPVLNTEYTRITLVSMDFRERITFDTDLVFSTGEKTRSFPDIVIGEIKHDASLRQSPARAELHRMGIRKTGFSKYCIGTSLLHSDLKYNRFKPKLLLLQKLSGGGSAVC